MKCSFFGCKKYTFEQFYFMRRLMMRLIEEKDVDTFYIVHQGSLDRVGIALVDYIRAEKHPKINLRYALPTGEVTENIEIFTRIAELEYNKEMPPYRAIALRYIAMFKSMDYIIASCRSEEAQKLLIEVSAQYKAKLIIVDNVDTDCERGIIYGKDAL